MLTKLENIKKNLENNIWSCKTDTFWRGADLVVIDHPIKDDSDRVIVTKYAKEISALLVEIWDACEDWRDGSNKYDLFGSIGDTIERISRKSDFLQGILISIVDTAINIEKKYTFKLYFAYGSNMDENQMEVRCPDAILFSVVEAPGYEFALDSSGVATIIPNSKKCVEGLLWLISPEDEKKLDRYEGVAAGCYRKETISVEDYNRRYEALVYISNRAPFSNRIRSGYMDRIISAAYRHRLSKSYIKSIEIWGEY